MWSCRVFLFKQKTAYEMRISDWSSDVCSSDLDAKPARAAMNDAIRQEGKSRSAHARSIGLAHAVVCSLCEQPEVMWAMLALKGTKVTERTAKSPCLPAIKALYPDLDRSEQSSPRSEEHTSELQSLMRISYGVFCLKK